METFIEVELNQKVLKQLGYKIKKKKCEKIDYGRFSIDDYRSLSKDGVEVTSIDIPATYEYEGKQYKITSIGKSFFYYSISLEEVKFSNKLKVIKSRTFSDCRSLKSVEIPKKVKKIEEYAFAGCTSLNLTIPDSVKEIGENAFLDVPNVNYNVLAIGSPWGAKAINGVEPIETM